MVICAIGAFTVHNAIFDIWQMVVFGVIGYIFKKLNYPLAPLVLALVLGDRAEDAFRQTMVGSKGALGVFWSGGLVGTIMTLAMIALLWPLVSNVIARFRRSEPALAVDLRS